MSERGLGRLPDFVIVGQEDWDEVERRNQLLVTALAARHPRTRFLFAELPVRSRSLLRARPPKVERVDANVFRVRTIRPLPDRIAALARINDFVEAFQLRRAIRAAALERPALWTQDPRAADLVERLPVARVVYDLTDDWAAFETDAGRRAQVQGRIETLAQRADVVLACSRALADQVEGLGVKAVHVPNGVDEPSAPAAEPDDVKALPRPRAGYVGTLHESRLDVDLLAEAAELRPEWSFVLLGPDQLSAAARARLFSLPNVHYLGVRPHDRVRAYLESLDVCLVPHRVTDFTRSLDPLKLYEYLAAGRPVVSTATGNAPELDAHVEFAATASELVACAERALASGPEAAAGRRRAVATATWAARAEQVEAALGVAAPAEDPAGLVSVVVPSFNTRELLERCLDRVREQRDVVTETIVVDNGSTDRSAALVAGRFPEVQLLELGENVGFARANNIAFELCRGEFVLLLNSDAFLEPDTLGELAAAARRHPEAAVVGPRLLNADGTFQRSAWPFPRVGRLLLESVFLHRALRRLGWLEDLGTWAHDEERAVDFLVGACLLVRREALAEVGGFDEAFWFYGEEADLCRRLAARGWTVVLAPRARATHYGGASATSSGQRVRLALAGQRNFLCKHSGRTGWALARIALLVGSMLRGRWQLVRIALDRNF